MGDTIKNAIDKINANEESLNVYVRILKRKISNATESIKKDEEQIEYIKERMEKSKVTLESEKLLLEGIESLILLSKNY